MKTMQGVLSQVAEKAAGLISRRRALFFGLLPAGAYLLKAQGTDTPIIISDGSLNLDASMPWGNFIDAGGGARSHPQGGKSVTQVVVTANGATQPISYSGQSCTVSVEYAGTNVTVATNNSGRALQVRTDFSSFRRGANDNVLTHVNPNSKISSVTVTRGGGAVFNASTSGGTQIKISYQ